MQRYILFAGNSKRPAGGYDDYIGSRNSVEALKKLATSCKVGKYHKPPSWADIVDVTTMGRLWSFRKGIWSENNAMPSNS